MLRESAILGPFFLGAAPPAGHIGEEPNLLPFPPVS